MLIEREVLNVLQIYDLVWLQGMYRESGDFSDLPEMSERTKNEDSFSLPPFRTTPKHEGFIAGVR
jgi:hypothetical protein